MEEYIDNIEINNISMQTLAYIGDSVYDIYLRTYLASKSNEQAGKLHKKAIKYVSAKSQSIIVDNLEDFLTQDEVAIYKRGRNTNITTVSKNVDVVSYKKATGFEALIGYLYVTKDTDRINKIIRKCIEIIENI